MKSHIENILSSHGCKLIKFISECRILWENQSGIIRDDDIFVLSNMSDKAWKYWEVN